MLQNLSVSIFYFFFFMTFTHTFPFTTSCKTDTYHGAVCIGQELSELRQQVLLVLKESGHLSVDLLLGQGRGVVPSCLLGVPLLFLEGDEIEV